MNLKKTTILLTILVVLISCNNDEKTTIKKEVDSVEIQTKIEENDSEDTVKYDKVIAYEFEGDGGKNIVSGSKLITKSKILLEKVLTNEEVTTLVSILNNTETYGGITAACFDPHFGIVYYKNEKIIDHVSICLGCNFLNSSFEIPAIKFHLTDRCDYCYNDGFSKNGRKLLSQFIKDLGFNRWKVNSTLFD
jgi:hypothetical protein